MLFIPKKQESVKALDTADIGNLPCEEELVVDVHSLTVSGSPLPVCIY
jgi:hypothetical protein